MEWQSHALKDGQRPLNDLNTMTVGDVHQTLCKQKETALYSTNGERNTLNRRLDLPFTANKVRQFRNYQLCVCVSFKNVKTCSAWLNKCLTRQLKFDADGKYLHF